MIINHNIAAMNTNRQLSSNDSATAKALQKLSSGLNINSSADDAAGMAISTKMENQIRGLDQASSNSENATSLVQTADGDLSTTSDILTRLRELAVESSNDTATDDDREDIQSEVDQLLAEVDDISSDSEFNTKKLLNGDLSNTAVVTGTSGNEFTSSDITVEDDDLDAGVYKVTFTGDPEISASVDTSEVNDIGLTASNLKLEGTAGTTIATGLSLGEDYTLTATENTASGTYNLALTDADGVEIASSTSWNGTTAAATVLTGTTADGTAISMTVTMTGGGTIAAGSMTFNLSATFSAGGTFTIAKQTYSTSTAVLTAGSTVTSAATLAAGTLTAAVTLTAGTTITTGTVNYGTAAATLSAGKTLTASVTITAGTTITAATYKTVSTLTAAKTVTTVTTSSATVYSNQNALTISNETFEAAGLKFDMDVDNVKTGSTTVTTTNNALVMQVGANEDQTMKIAINEISTESLGISKVDLSTQSGAESAISVIDKAISTVSAESSKLGAYQNRLDYTNDNLGTASDNLTSAQSTITDVDMAAEMTEYTKYSILSQAATAMLAQANQLPQNVLSLLK